MQTPHKRSFAAEELQRRQQKKPWIWIFVSAVAITLVIGGLLYVRMMQQKQVETEEKITSIAVLPFDNISGDEAQEHLCRGIAESIINALANVGRLQVKASTSSVLAKEKGYSIEEIGENLHVQSVLEGSLQKSGDRLRIYVQLINVKNGFHIWSQPFESSLDDIFSIQDEIAQTIVEKLNISVTGKEETAIGKRYTENIEAYNLYLQGRYYWNKRTDEGFDRALDYFRQATDKDPTYAIAFAGIADAYLLKGFYGYLSPKDAFPKAKAAAEKALLLDTTIAEAHTSRAFILLCYYWDWATAESEFRKALELNPNYANTHHWYSQYLLVMGRVDDAISEIQRARELDPLSLQINAAVGSVLIIARKYDEAIEQLQKTLEMDPNHPTTYWFLGSAYYDRAMWKEAIEAYQEFFTLSGSSPFALSCLGSTYAASGQKDEALQILDTLEKLSKERYVSPFHRATIYIALGEMDKAFEYLEESYMERNLFLIFLKVSPSFDPIRSDPRFKELTDKIGLP